MKRIRFGCVLLMLMTAMVCAGAPEANATAVSTGNVKPQDARYEQLKLMYNSFTYTSDLENAYKVTQQALEAYPDSIFWHERAAEVSDWQGRREEVIKNLRFIYDKTKDKALEEKILAYAMENRQFREAEPMIRQRVLDDPSQKHIKDLIFVYHEMGEPETAASFLETEYANKKLKAAWLEEAMRIYMMIGDDEGAKRVAQTIQSQGYSFDSAKLLSYYYLTQRDSEKSFKVLRGVDASLPDVNATAYYRQVSDMGWHLQYFKEAAEASKELLLSGNARLSDIQRVLAYYGQSDPALVEKAAMEGYGRYNDANLYGLYLNSLFSRKDYGRLAGEFAKAEGDAKYAYLTSTIYYWLMKAETYRMLQAYDKAQQAYDRALLVAPDSAEVWGAILWFYIDTGNMEGVERLVGKFERNGYAKKRVFWLPLAVAHFSMQRSDRAMGYVKRLMEAEPEDIEVKFMYANILQMRGEEDGFMNMMRGIYRKLEAQKIRNPGLMGDKKFLEQYLKTGIYFIPPDRYRVLLKRAEKALDAKVYTDITIFRALKDDEQELARYLTRKLSKVEPWMQLNMALYRDDRTWQLDLIERYKKILPIRDRVTAAERTFNIATAQSLGFKGLEENSWDYPLYKQRRDLIETYSDYVQAKTGYRRYSGLGEAYLESEGRHYVAEGWRAVWKYNHSGFDKQGTDKTKYYRAIPSHDDMFAFGLEKLFERGKAGVTAHYKSQMETYFGYEGWLDYRVTGRVSLNVGYAQDADAKETSYLLLGGKKDEISFSLAYQLLPSTKIQFDYRRQTFFSQDDIRLGEGDYAKIEWYRQIRSGYPDMAWSVYADMGRYGDENHDVGVLEDVRPAKNFRMIPDDYCNLGARFSYGMENRYVYTRVWRPFAEVGAAYGICNNAGLNLSGVAGYGGSLWGQDQLSVGVSYDQGLNGTQESRSEIFLNYKLFY